MLPGRKRERRVRARAPSPVILGHRPMAHFGSLWVGSSHVTTTGFRAENTEKDKATEGGA